MSERGRLRTDEVAAVLDVSASTVIAHTKGGLLRTTRTPGGHRRYDAGSVRELARVLEMPEGPERDAEMEALRLRNQARHDADGQAWDALARYCEARGVTMASVVTPLVEAEVQRLREAGELP
ncbi:helix-turn-helix domain-containing protein [Plantactinospora sp. WMMB782]|uniref:helix-turn-helix domain-containing protein n=1 Tax=Plantactinospora sp. WMMB782 TaxID=3404121 RepID=UPI003B9660B4